MELLSYYHGIPIILSWDSYHTIMIIYCGIIWWFRISGLIISLYDIVWCMVRLISWYLYDMVRSQTRKFFTILVVIVINHHQDMVGGLYLQGGGLEVDTSFRFSPMRRCSPPERSCSRRGLPAATELMTAFNVKSKHEIPRGLFILYIKKAIYNQQDTRTQICLLSHWDAIYDCVWLQRCSCRFIIAVIARIPDPFMLRLNMSPEISLVCSLCWKNNSTHFHTLW